MTNQILAFFTPTPEAIANWSFFLVLLLAVMAVLAATWLVSDYLIDAVTDRVLLFLNRRRSGVVDFTEARRRRSLDAIVRTR